MLAKDMRFFASLILIVLGLSACNGQPINSPYPPEKKGESVLYTSFSIRPKHLDPARSYSANEVSIIGQIYEPPLQYHYLKRPYQLIPSTASAMPTVTYLDKQGNKLPANTNQDVAYSVYTIHIQPGIYYQPHPAFVRKADGSYLYQHLTPTQLSSINKLSDFKKTATRELIAADYVYEIKRLADPRVHSPILGLMSGYIVGLKDYAKHLNQLMQQGKPIDLRANSLTGVKAIDRYTYQIEIHGKYPQFRYWLAMPFFAPVPWEADKFYQQPVLQQKNITLDWYPVGTGPYYLTENNPNRRMVLLRNPNFHKEYYPTEGEPGDRAAGLLDDAGKRLPFIDKIVFTLEKESTSYWNKFLQGYYDVSGVSSDSFDQAIHVSSSGGFSLTPSMKKKGIQLETAVGTSTYYIGFNMLDPVVGGETERARKLRQAISIAIDEEEYISIFANGRGIPAQGPIPPGIFGYVEGAKGVNSYVYDWHNGHAQRKSLQTARELLAEAGYPNGRDAKTGDPLVLYFDVPATGPDAKFELDWLRKQFRKLNIQLVIRSTDYNRFQDKMRRGREQIFQWGWNADYPDPENFLFLLYGPNGKVEHGGENAANYHNARFDALYEKMRVMPNNAARKAVIAQMVKIVRKDAPWVWGFHPKQLSLFHQWNKNVKPNLMANNSLKYRRVDSELRDKLRKQWNQPELWPLWLVLISLILLTVPAIIKYRHKKHQKPHLG